MKKLISVFTVLLFLSCVGAVFAQTPDGMPPSEESVCDVLAVPDATPGLFGLCNAYCEAQDCHLYVEGEEPRSCQQLLANYERKQTASDPDMPCGGCPCLQDVDIGSLGTPLCDGNTVTFDPSGAVFMISEGQCIFESSTVTHMFTDISQSEEDACLAFLVSLCPPN